jgi:hypothetical protein
MVTARAGHVAIRLQSGKVLVTGGGQASAELYDPVTDTWSPTGSMTFTRFGHAGVLLLDGRAMVIGGTPSNICTGPPVGNSAELFDPATETWVPTGTMNVARNAPTAIVLADGKVLVAGGGNRCGGLFSTAEIFDPATGNWTPVASMNVSRQAPFGTLLPNGKALVAGGRTQVPYPFPTVASAELYDPPTGSWTLTGSMHDSRMLASDNESNTEDLILLPSGKVLTAGGFSLPSGLGGPAIYLSAAEFFDPATGTWAQTGGMAAGRQQHRTTLLATGQVLVTGGRNSTGGLNTAEVFDPAAGTFGPGGTMAGARWGHTATLLLDGRVLLAGGGVAPGVITATAEIYSSPTPQEQLQAVLDALLADEDLNGNVAGSLASKLENVVAKLDKDNVNAAINQLQAFINEIEALIQSGQLAQPDGEILIDVTQGVIAQLSS